MNKKLQKQLKKFFSESENHSPGMNAFLKEVSKTYDVFEKESLLISDALTKLEKMNRELDQFAYIVAHDLKAPLRAISSISNWIEEDISATINTETRNNFNQLKARVQRMENLIEGILTYAKASKTAALETVCTNKLVNEVFASVNTKQNVTLTCGSKMPTFLAERLKLEQVFANLISNAIKYNDKENCEVFVDCIELEDILQFSVRDNGPGIDVQYHRKVFEIFQTLQSRDSLESTGIGLSIVKKIVEEKGGKIWVESVIGHGTNFVFTWPKLNQSVSKEIIKSNT